WFQLHHLPPGHIHQPVHQLPLPAPVHTAVIGGTPGWQITLIVVTAALLAAALAVLADRSWVARRRKAGTAAWTGPPPSGALARRVRAPLRARSLRPVRAPTAQAPKATL